MALKYPKPSAPTAGLWWAAVVILIIGGLVVYLLSLDPLARNVQTHIGMTMVITVVGSGLCVIGATSQWWMRH